MAPDKDQSFRLRLTGEDRAKLEAIAKVMHRSAADAVRFLIAEKHGQMLLSAAKTHADLRGAEVGGNRAVAESILASVGATLETLKSAQAPQPKTTPRKKSRKK